MGTFLTTIPRAAAVLSTSFVSAAGALGRVKDRARVSTCVLKPQAPRQPAGEPFAVSCSAKQQHAVHKGRRDAGPAAPVGEVDQVVAGDPTANTCFPAPSLPTPKRIPGMGTANAERRSAFLPCLQSTVSACLLK